MTTASVLWRRLDTPGHDACWLEGDADGWLLRGAAVFRHEGVAARLEYEVRCDRAWVSTRGRVRGRIGARPVDLAIERRAGGTWRLDGAVMPEVEGLSDLDLGFTPATNLFQLRRLHLAQGQAADAPVAWLDAGASTLVRLPQRYERRSESGYWYEAPTVGYRGLLEVTPLGFVREYPGLWTLELD
jgi:hypothetical protein